MKRPYRVLIIGAGVAGLTAAIALRRAGHEALVFERASKLDALGAGLILWSNAISALRAVDLEPPMLEIGSPLAGLIIRTPDGRALASTDARSLAERAGAPTLAVHRAELTNMLGRSLSDDALQLGRTFTRFSTSAEGVIAHFEDGHEEAGDALIGADGIWSAVRSQIHGPESPRYSGYTAWRSVIKREPQRVVRTLNSTETWGRGTRFGWVPLSEDRVYWFAVKAAPPGEQVGPGGHKAELQELFGEWHRPIPETIHAAAESEILRHDIYDRPPLRRWGSGPVTLAGDAAHPTTPNLGQGAAMGIEDAVVLAQALSQDRETIALALRDYEDRRFSRTAMVTNTSYRMGTLAQVQHPIGVSLRNTLMWLMPDRLTTAQIGGVTSWKP